MNKKELGNRKDEIGIKKNWEQKGRNMNKKELGIERTKQE